MDNTDAPVDIARIWKEGAELSTYIVDKLKEREDNEDPYAGLVACAILYSSIAKLIGMTTHESLELIMIVSKKLEEKIDTLQ